MLDKDKKQQFLDELSALTSKHGIAIGGCGCCGSPWLTDEVLGANAKSIKVANGRYKCGPKDDGLEWKPNARP